MAQKYNAGLVDTLTPSQNWQIQFVAVDPTSGVAVAGAKVSNVNFIVEMIRGTVEDLQVGPFMLVPGPGA
jgi:hypothetical protein